MDERLDDLVERVEELELIVEKLADYLRVVVKTHQEGSGVRQVTIEQVPPTPVMSQLVRYPDKSAT